MHEDLKEYLEQNYKAIFDNVVDALTHTIGVLEFFEKENPELKTAIQFIKKEKANHIE